MTDSNPGNQSLLPDFNSEAAARYRQFRHLKDALTRYLMAMGGISVIIVIILIAFYLLYVVIPMFKPPHIEQLASYPLPSAAQTKTLYYAMEEQHETALRVTADGDVVFFKTKDGGIVKQHSVTAAASAELTAFAAGDPAQRLLAFGLSDGSALLVQHEYKLSYPNDVRLITPTVAWPLGKAPVETDPDGEAIRMISAQVDAEQASIAALTADNRLLLLHFQEQESFLSDDNDTVVRRSELAVPENITQLLLDVEQRGMYLADKDGFVSYYDISHKDEIRLVQKVRAAEAPAQISSLSFLSGGISILVGDSQGHVTQWFPVRDKDNNYTLEKIRSFDALDGAVTAIVPEYFRKGFLAADTTGSLTIYHATAQRTVTQEKISEGTLKQIAIAPRANALLLEDAKGQLQYWAVDNEHPEISWRGIWGKVWYESRDKEEYIWQSSSASSDFEPKFSLTPLVFGTLKAAFYAMLFAVPMAIFGAMYTAYFMSAGLRGIVKPTIEIMEALPTVILGFLAGLWFAPFVEQNMPGLFLFMAFLPLTVMASAYLWSTLPENIRHKVADGWEAALLIPVIILTAVFTFSISQPLEIALFAGNMPLWLTDELGISYDQRNSLVVGIAMGFAVIPTIFSISEDAVYSVPKHLTTGSLALGATPWQTMVRVVLLTASPGIFSAIMIGTGRAVGETMIVLMATGNTAIMDMNIFEGFRALSANIAVEMPESEVGSTHYRILFLAGLVLFVATFMFNTVAEVVRQRLRVKYSSL